MHHESPVPGWTRGALFALVAATACGDGGSGPADDSNAGDLVEDAAPPDGIDDEASADREEDAGSDPGDTADGDAALPTSLTVRVTGSVWWDPLHGDPLADALVALDAPDGRRIERTTDAGGRATFDGLDWTMGPAAVTAWRDGFALASRLGVTAADGEVALDLPRPRDYRPRFGVLHGWAANMTDDRHILVVSATVPDSTFFYTGPEWWIELLPWTPFTLVAAEVDFASLPGPRSHGWTVFAWLLDERPGTTGWTEVGLDFSRPAAAAAAHGAFALPTRRDSPLYRDAEGGVWVTSVASAQTACLGLDSRIELLPDAGGFDYDVQFVTPDDVTDPLTIFYLGVSWLVGDPQAEYASVRVAGYPVDGPLPVPFLDAPRILVPAAPAAGHPLHAPLEWELFDADVDVALVVNSLDPDEMEDEALWPIRRPPDATSAPLPDLPLALRELQR